MPTSPAPQTAEDATLTLAPRQDLSGAGRLRDWFLAREGDATIDATAVEIVTTPALQILIAGSDLIRRRGGQISVACPSPAFARCLTDLGSSLERLTEGARPGGEV